MAVRFLIPGALRPLAGGQSVVSLEAKGRTLGEALEALWAAHPGLRLRIVDEQGQVRPHVNIFVGVDSARDTGGLSTPVGQEGEIAIIPAVSGGAAIIVCS
jgi:sulfur-carrier protein